jgi:hypothetical protein
VSCALPTASIGRPARSASVRTRLRLRPTSSSPVYPLIPLHCAVLCCASSIAATTCFNQGTCNNVTGACNCFAFHSGPTCSVCDQNRYGAACLRTASLWLLLLLLLSAFCLPFLTFLCVMGVQRVPARRAPAACAPTRAIRWARAVTRSPAAACVPASTRTAARRASIRSSPAHSRPLRRSAVACRLCSPASISAPPLPTCRFRVSRAMCRASAPHK